MKVWGTFRKINVSKKVNSFLCMKLSFEKDEDFVMCCLRLHTNVVGKV